MRNYLLSFYIHFFYILSHQDPKSQVYFTRASDKGSSTCHKEMAFTYPWFIYFPHNNKTFSSIMPRIVSQRIKCQFPETWQKGAKTKWRPSGREGRPSALHCALESMNYFRSVCFALFRLPIHLCDILVKLVHFTSIICTIIDDFVFLPPPSFIFILTLF